MNGLPRPYTPTGWYASVSHREEWERDDVDKLARLSDVDGKRPEKDRLVNDLEESRGTRAPPHAECTSDERARPPRSSVACLEHRRTVSRTEVHTCTNRARDVR